MKVRLRLITTALFLCLIAIAGSQGQTTQPVTTVNGGTPNAVPKFTGTSSVENSAIVESGGKVGIGTNSPTSKLAVQLADTSDAGLLVTDGTNASNIVIQPLGGTDSGFQSLNFNGYVNGSTNGGIQRFNTNKNFWRLLVDQRGTADEFRLSTYDSFGARNLFTVAATGEFGIGTQTPSEKLHVIGNIKIGGSGHGILFPDGSTQTTAELMGPAGPQGPKGATGPAGSQGPPGPGSTSAVCTSIGSANASCGCAIRLVSQAFAPAVSGGSSCTATSNTGSCSQAGGISGGAPFSGACCVCAPN